MSEEMASFVRALVQFYIQEQRDTYRLDGKQIRDEFDDLMNNSMLTDEEQSVIKASIHFENLMRQWGR